jgi:hypothetical protein
MHATRLLEHRSEVNAVWLLRDGDAALTRIRTVVIDHLKKLAN